jgi:hypothetical protein
VNFGKLILFLRGGESFEIEFHNDRNRILFEFHGHLNYVSNFQIFSDSIFFLFLI